MKKNVALLWERVMIRSLDLPAPARRLRYENRKCVTLRAYLAHPRAS